MTLDELIRVDVVFSQRRSQPQPAVPSDAVTGHARAAMRAPDITRT